MVFDLVSLLRDLPPLNSSRRIFLYTSGHVIFMLKTHQCIPIMHITKRILPSKVWKFSYALELPHFFKSVTCPSSFSTWHHRTPKDVWLFSVPHFHVFVHSFGWNIVFTFHTATHSFLSTLHQIDWTIASFRNFGKKCFLSTIENFSIAILTKPMHVSAPHHY